MPREIWTYVAVKPNNNRTKVRPVLIIGDDSNNGLQFVDIHYVIISSSSECGYYDILIEEESAKEMGLSRKSVIKTTKIYTGSKTKLGKKICDLPESIKKEFISKLNEYHKRLIEGFYN